MNSVVRATPTIPVEYLQAVQSLQACTKIDESKYWSDKADALAAWAKIYRSNTAAVEAKKLKLHAYRRMGEIAEQLRPTGRIAGVKGHPPGALSLLREHGLTNVHARSAVHLRKMPEEKFKELIAQPAPPSPTGAYKLGVWGNASKKLSQLRSVASNTRSFCKNMTPEEMSSEILDTEIPVVIQLSKDLVEWFDRLEQILTARVGNK